MVSFLAASLQMMDLSLIPFTTSITTLAWLVGILVVADQAVVSSDAFLLTEAPGRRPRIQVVLPVQLQQQQPPALSPPFLRHLYTTSNKSNAMYDENNDSNRSNVNNFCFLNLKQLIQILDERGIRYPATASRQDLEELLLTSVGQQQHQQQQQQPNERVRIDPNPAVVIENTPFDNKTETDTPIDVVAQRERAKRRRQRRRRMLQNQQKQKPQDTSSNKRNNSRILSDYYNDVVAGVVPEQLVQRAKRKAQRLKRRLSDFWALDEETGGRDVRYHYVAPVPAAAAAASNNDNSPSKQRKPAVPVQPKVVERVRTTTTSNAALVDDKKDDDDVIDVAAQEVEVVHMSRLDDDSAIVDEDDDGGVNVFVARPIPTQTATPTPNQRSRARRRRPPPTSYQQQPSQRPPTARTASSAADRVNDYYYYNNDSRNFDPERFDTNKRPSSFSRYPYNTSPPQTRPSRNDNSDNKQHQPQPQQQSISNNNIYRLPPAGDGGRRRKSVNNDTGNNGPQPFPYAYRRPRSADNPYRRPPPQQKSKKVYSPYNSNNENNIFNRYSKNDDEEDRDVVDRVGDFLADTADAFMWGRYDVDYDDEGGAFSSQKRQPSSRSDGSSPTTPRASSSTRSSPKRKFWKDRLEERLDSMLGIHEDGDFYHSWSDRFRQEHQNDNNVGNGYDAFDVAQGRQRPSKGRQQQNRRQNEKPFWEDDDNLVSLLFGGRGGKRKSIGSIWDDLYERQSMSGRSEFASGSVLLILRAALCSFFLVFGRLCGWASVQGALPQPVVVTGVAAAGLCAPAGRRIWAVAGTLLAMRATGELLHGYTLDDEDYDDDYYHEEEDDDKGEYVGDSE